MKLSVIDRWATHPLFVKTIVERIKEELANFSSKERDNVIILFSAHSLPLQVAMLCQYLHMYSYSYLEIIYIS